MLLVTIIAFYYKKTFLGNFTRIKRFAETHVQILDLVHLLVPLELKNEAYQRAHQVLWAKAFKGFKPF